MTTLEITIKSLETVRDEALEVAQAIDDPDQEPEKWGDRRVISFASYDVMTTHLTSKRLELIQAIGSHDPDSVRETADIVDRDVGDVSRDLQRLEGLDIVEMDDGGPGLPSKPSVPYDRIEFDIGLDLVDDVDTDAAASAG
ncbi:transcriptional regulator [Natrarchaeobius sp. A-rgal3]|uniref:HVO_A0114 family putative DNA-binding protein n=1 Tax=Natrarchaeobius versutus TaxID=1679078 RepID=UPI00350F635D